MTLNKRKLRKLCESLRISCTRIQERIILGRFSTEPEPYEWTEQDIVVQIENYLGCGEFVKSGKGGSRALFGDKPKSQYDDDDFF